MAGASKVGTITDPLKGRVVVDEYLNEVGAGASGATYVFKPHDLKKLKLRREELGLGNEDEAKRAQADSRKIEAAKAERKAADAETDAAVIRAAAKADEKKSAEK